MPPQLNLAFGDSRRPTFSCYKCERDGLHPHQMISYSLLRRDGVCVECNISLGLAIHRTASRQLGSHPQDFTPAVE